MIKIFNSLFLLLKTNFDKDKDNWVLWIPILFSIGIILYFYYEYFSKLLILIFILLIFVFVLNKKCYYTKILNIIILFILFGYLRSYYFVKDFDNFMLEYPLGLVKVYGKIEKEIINRRYDGDFNKEIIVKVYKIKNIRNNKIIKDIPNKLKIRLKNADYKINLSDVIIKTSLFPIQDKYFKTDFDFKKLMFFQGIGGIGYNGEIIFNDTISQLSFKQKVDSLRFNIAKRIIDSGDNYKSLSIIAVLLTGQKSIADKQAVESMNYSGLAHLLSISGLHMMTLIGLVMFMVKWLLLRSEQIALKYNVYKISAIVSLIINFFYLLLSGASVSAVRAYIMSVILLFSIIIERFNYSIRSVMLAMFIISFYKPYLIFNVGFQMSFMTVIGLISLINLYYDYLKNSDDTLFKRILSGKISQFFILGFLMSITAECATTPFLIYNFNNYSFYNIFVNSFLTPLVSFIVLPFALFSLLLFPIHLEWLTIIPASYVMSIILFISDFITKIPNAVMFVKSPNILSMFLMIIGFLWFCLWNEKWRKIGIILYIIGILIIPFQKNIDVLINNIDKMIIFDTGKRAYIYNINKYKMNKILKKLVLMNIMILKISMFFLAIRKYV